jgi:hypothetical protein
MEKTRTRLVLRAAIRGFSLGWLALGVALLATGAPESAIANTNELFDGVLGFLLPGAAGLLLAHMVGKPRVRRT